MNPIDIYHGQHGLPCCSTQSIVVPSVSIGVFILLPAVLLLISWLVLRWASNPPVCRLLLSYEGLWTWGCIQLAASSPY